MPTSGQPSGLMADTPLVEVDCCDTGVSATCVVLSAVALKLLTMRLAIEEAFGAPPPAAGAAAALGPCRQAICMPLVRTVTAAVGAIKICCEVVAGRRMSRWPQ